MKMLREGSAPWLQKLRQFYLSPWCLAVLFAVAAVVTVLRIEIVGIFVFLAFVLVELVLSDSLIAPAAPILLTCLFLIRVSEFVGFSSDTNALYDRFLPLWWLIFIPPAVLVFHAVAYKKPIKWTKTAWVILAVSVATTIGGLGSISAKEYFAGGAMYHTAALGFGMLLTYLWLSSALEKDSDRTLQSFIPNMMIMLGLFAVFMVLHYYLVRLPYLIKAPHLLAFQWRNNASTFLMLALPFPFFKSFKKPLFLLTGLLMYLALLLSGSRGGMLFGTIELVMCVLFLLFADKKRRLLYLIITASIIVAVIVMLPLLLPFFKPVILRFLQSVFYGEEDVRVRLFGRAIQDFKNHPFFGTGLGYMGNRDIHPSKDFALCWYHCAPLQVIGSFGVVGLLAYGAQTVMRVCIFLRRPATKFRMTLMLSWIGLAMMSLVNPGVFAPIPYLLTLTILVVVAEKSADRVQPGTMKI